MHFKYMTNLTYSEAWTLNAGVMNFTTLKKGLLRNIKIILIVLLLGVQEYRKRLLKITFLWCLPHPSGPIKLKNVVPPSPILLYIHIHVYCVNVHNGLHTTMNKTEKQQYWMIEMDIMVSISHSLCEFQTGINFRDSSTSLWGNVNQFSLTVRERNSSMPITPHNDWNSHVIWTYLNWGFPILRF